MKRILVIDDEADLIKEVQVMLEYAGYEVLAASRGGEGVETAIAEQPDLIILDILMPGMDGFEALRRLKENAETEHIPVIILSCKGESQSLFKAQELGSTDYIIKPFEQDELLALIKKCL